MSSQMFEDSQQCAETQLDDDSQASAVLDPPLGNPGGNLPLVGLGVGGDSPRNCEEEAAGTTKAKDCLSSTATRLPPTSVQQRLGQRRADAWTEMPRKYRGVMNYECNPAA